MATFPQRYSSSDSNTAGAFYFEEISGTHYSASKVQWGAAGAVNFASAATPLPVTGVITGDALTSLQTLDDVVYVDDADWTGDTSKHMLVGGVYESSPQTITDGDVGPFQVTTQGFQIVGGAHANSLGKAEDTAHSSGDVGVMSLAVRDDTLDVRSGTEGDYEPFHTNANGALWVIDVNSASALTALQLLDDVIFTDDLAYTPGTSKLLMVGAQADETGADDVHEGDAGALRMTLSRAIHVNMRDDAGDSCMDGTNNALRVNVVTGTTGTSTTDDGAFTAASGSGTPIMGFVTTDTVDSGDVGVVGMTAQRTLKCTLYSSAGAEQSLTGGTQYTEDDAAAGNPVGNAIVVVRDDSRGGGLVTTNGDNVALRGTNSGELYVKHFDAVTCAQSGSWVVVVNGNVPHDSSLVGVNPLAIGGYASAAAPTNVSGDGDAVYAWMLRNGATCVNVTAAGALIGGDATNGLDVDVTRSALPTGASTLAEQQTQTTHLGTIAGDTTDIETAVELIDDAVFTDDTTTFTAGTTKGLMIGAAVDDDSTDAANEGDLVVLRATAERKLRTVAALDSASMQSGNDQVTPKFKVIDHAGSGDNEIVALVADKKIRVLSVVLVSSGTVTVRFESGAGGTALTGQMQLTAQTGFSSGFSPVGHFETAAGANLNLELSGAVSVDGFLTYIETD